jgi:putative Mn2+ efflux pump MntP
MWVSLLLLAMGLAADAAAVAAAIGACGGRRVVRASFVFGAFQGGMALLGAVGGALAGAWFGDWDHVLALLLLTGLGLRAAWNGWREAPAGEAPPLFETWGPLLVAGIATSIDALAAGVTLPAFGIGLGWAAGVVGGVTTAACLLAGAAGRRLGEAFGRPVQIAGGFVLVGIGLQVYASHTHLFG